MGRGYKAERKKWPSTRFFVTAALFHTRNKVQTLRFAFSRRIIIPCSLKEYISANDKFTELKYTNYTTTLFSSVTCVVILLSLSIFHSEIRRTIISSLSLAITETCSLLTVSSSFVSVTSTFISVSCPLILFSIA